MDITPFLGMKKTNLIRDRLMNGLPCVCQQDSGGKKAYTLLPDTQAVSHGITDSLREGTKDIQY